MLKNNNNGILPYDWLMMDNDGVHTDAMLAEVSSMFNIGIVLNVPNNPAPNPIEWIFGVAKAQFRKLIVGREAFTPKDILETLRNTQSRYFGKTMVSNLRYLANLKT